MIWKRFILNFQIPLCGYLPKFEKGGGALFVSSFIRSQKKILKKILKYKKRLNFIVLNLVVADCINWKNLKRHRFNVNRILKFFYS